MIHVPVAKLNRAALEARYLQTISIYEGYLADVYAKLMSILRNSSIDATVKQRVKTFDSFFSKILRKAKELNGKAENGAAVVLITDLLGIRVVCPFLEDTLRVEELVRRHFEVFERERKGEDLSPREFGYESTHVVVRVPGPKKIEGMLQEEVLCEIQIRTILQDAWAEVEHELMYKAEFTPFDEPLRRKLAAVNANLSLSDIIFQEIRDYQRRLQDELKKRRKSFLQKLQTESEELKLQEKEPAPVSSVPEQTHSPTVETVDNLLLEALTAHNQRRYPEAIAIYTRILSRHPKKTLRSVIYIHRGMAYFGDSRYKEALEDFTKAIGMDETNARAYYYRGVVHRFQKDQQLALADFDHCLEIDPYQFDPLFGRAQVYFSLGDYIRAYEDCTKALAIKPTVQEARRFYEVVLRRMQF